MTANPPPSAGVFVDARGLLCVQVLLLRHLAALPSGEVVTVAADDPAAPIDLPAWCHLTGHTYLGSQTSQPGPMYTIRVGEDTASVDPQRPWLIPG
ncbi:sulfurtransferase TusA family protein [Actinomycetes bacterium KLBMP 9797]